MSLKDQAFRVAVLGALKDAITTEWLEQRGVLMGQLLDAHADQGLKSVEVSLPDGTKVATITLKQPHGKPEVYDEDAFTKWVTQAHPTEVQTVTTVRPAFRKAFLESLHDWDVDVVFDPQTGEVIPGVRFRPGAKPSEFGVRYTPEGRHAIGDAWQRSQLPGYAPLDLELDEGGV